MIHAVSINFNSTRPQFNFSKNMIEHIRHVGIVVSDLKVLTDELFLRFYKSIYSYADHRLFSAMVSRVNANWGRAKAFCG